MKLPTDYTKLTSDERRRVRIHYAKMQDNKCMYCKAPLIGDPPAEVMTKSINWKLFPPNFEKHPIHLQHNHDTGMTEGAVHARCNAVLWQYHGR